MANISLYVSGQTELSDVTEFFQKRLLGEGETPIAFFDGVFYESHQERVGNIVFQDYLIYSDKALYLWARGSSKDYLDRFNLGAVSVNSRNKDSAFATLNLKIRREEKEPVYVIFDMVEIREAETIVKLHTVVESTIEDYLGVNYRQEIPDDTADRILEGARKYCPPRNLSIPLESPQIPVSDAGIGYGQDLLEQYKASIGYNPNQDPQQQGRPSGARQPAGMGPQDAIRGGIESMLPTDPASLKRIADQIKNMVGDAPFKLRDQVMKDLQHVPGDVATVLTALNELLSNIAGNPLAERFVMNAIKTAVVNDGVLGSLTKIIKLTSGSGKKPARPAAAPSQEEQPPGRSNNSNLHDDPEDDTTIRRKKISVKDDDERQVYDPFADNDDPIVSRENRQQTSRAKTPFDADFDDDSEIKRKKISIKMDDDDGSGANEIARKLMSYDESERDHTASSTGELPVIEEPVADPVVRKKKLSIKAEEGSGAEAEIARKLMSYDEAARHGESSEPSFETSGSPVEGTPAREAVPETSRKKIRIKAESEAGDGNGTEAGIAGKLMSNDEESRAEGNSVQSPGVSGSPVDPVTASQHTVESPRKKIKISAPEPEAFSIPEDIVFAALRESEPDDRSNEYMTIESDDPVQKPVPDKDSEPALRKSGNAGKGGPAGTLPRKNGVKDGGDESDGDKHLVTVKITP
ncbi:MAG TPA: hypothetical protein VN371_07850 [Chlorobaculum sp.]|nr:hypothetical protein [Chlorobaculum sp.]